MDIRWNLLAAYRTYGLPAVKEKCWNINGNKFEILIAVLLAITFFWDVTPYRLVNGYRPSGRLYFIHIQSREVGVCYSEDTGNGLFRNNGRYLPVDTTYHSIRLESAFACLRFSPLPTAVMMTNCA
jgi:hypothetical protein